VRSPSAPLGTRTVTVIVVCRVSVSLVSVIVVPPLVEQPSDLSQRATPNAREVIRTPVSAVARPHDRLGYTTRAENRTPQSRWLEVIDFLDDLHRFFCVCDELQHLLLSASSKTSTTHRWICSSQAIPFVAQNQFSTSATALSSCRIGCIFYIANFVEVMS